MAGLGRRTHYRKHLTDQVLFHLPEPEKADHVAKVVSTRGTNQFDVKLAGGRDVLAILPTKFCKLVWVKRGEFVVVSGVEDSVEEGGDHETAEGTGNAIRHMIKHILYKDQIQHLKSKGLWPEDDADFTTTSSRAEETRPDEVGDGIVYADDEDDDLLFVNTNRIANMQLHDSDSSDGDGDDS